MYNEKMQIVFLPKAVSVMGDSFGMSDEFREYVMDLLEMNDISSLLADLSARTGCDTAYRDIASGRTFTGSPDRLFNERVRSFPLHELQRIFSTIPISESGRTYGHLFASGGCDMRSPLVSAASLGISLLTRRDSIMEQKERLFEDHFLRDLLSGALTDKIEIGERLRLLGHGADSPCFALAIQHSLHSDLSEERVADMVKTFFPRTLYTSRNGGMLCAVFQPPRLGEIAVGENLRNLANLFARRAKGMMRLGVGSRVVSLASFADSADEAESALFLGGAGDGDRTLFVWSELGSARVMGLIAESSEGRELHDASLGKIEAYDAQYGMNLLGTLAALDEYSWNLRIAAGHLSVHLNTVKYRYAKICELLDVDLKMSSVRFNIALALKLHKIYEFKKNMTTGRARGNDIPGEPR